MYLTVCSNSRVAFNFFFFTHTPTTEIYTLSLHDALPISIRAASAHFSAPPTRRRETAGDLLGDPGAGNFDQDTAIGPQAGAGVDAVRRDSLHDQVGLHRAGAFLGKDLAGRLGTDAVGNPDHAHRLRFEAVHP